MRAITNGTVYAGSEAIQDGVVVTESSAIQAVGPLSSTAIPQGAEMIDARGGMIIPGLIDIHTFGNGGAQISSPERVADELPRLAHNLASCGVTGFLVSPEIGDRSFNTQILAALAKAIPRTNGGAQALGIHLEGPWIDPERRGGFPERFLHGPSLEEARQYIEAAQGRLRMVTMAPDYPLSLDTAQYLRDSDVCASLGHTNATYEVARDSLSSGLFTLVTHVFNAMSGLHHREPGVLGAVLDSDDVKCMIICDGVHVHPVAVRLLLRVLGSHRLIVVTDSNSGAGLNEGAFRMFDQTIRIVGGVGRLPDGTIAGSTLTMNRALMNMRTFCGLSLGEALRFGTSNPAEILGLARKGNLAKGMDADIVVMDGGGNVTLTMVAGEVVFSN